MTIKDKNRIKYFLVVLLFLRFCCAVIYCFLPFNNPHFQRQVDTLGVSLRYWLRFTQENSHSYTAFLPAVLNSGDAMGIMPMEFPILNFICAPFFYFGPYWGKVSASLFVTLLAAACIFFNYSIWKNKKILNEDAGLAMLLFPILSFSQVFTWRFMPDFISVILCLMAVGLSWTRRRFFLSFTLLSVGLCMKPSSVIVLPLFFLQDGFFKQFSKDFFKNLKKYVWSFFAIAVAAFYYTIVLHWIRSYSDTTPFFNTNMHNPLQNLKEFYGSIYSFFDLLDFHLFFPYGFIFSFIICFFYYLKKKKILCLYLWLLCFLQIFIIAFLDGKHSYVHYYYFIGAAPTAALIALGLWGNIGALFSPAFTRILRFMFIALFLGSYADKAHMDLRFSSLNPAKNPVPYSDCERLIKRNPNLPWENGSVFRSKNNNIPSLGICFGVRTASLSSTYGLYFKNETMPTECKKLDEENNVVVAKCIIK